MDAKKFQISTRARCTLCDQLGPNLEKYCLCDEYAHKECAENILSKEEFCSQCGFVYQKRYAAFLFYIDFLLIFRVLWFCLIFLLFMFESTTLYAIILGSYFLLQEVYKIYGKNIEESDDLSKLFFLLGINNQMCLLLQHMITLVNASASTMSMQLIDYCGSKLAPLTAKTIKVFGSTWYW